MKGDCVEDEVPFTRSASMALGYNMDDGHCDETVCTKDEDRDILVGPGHSYENIAPNAGGLPDSNPKSRFGTKKPPLLSTVPATALLVEGQVMALGASKYGPFNWRDNSVAASVYIDAAVRHLLAWNSGQDDDPESGVSHLGHVRACMGILIDALETGNLIDDRPKDKVIAQMLERYTRKD